jgi:hypothetical protein
MIRIVVCALALAATGCDYDDPENPGGELGRVDFVRFYEPGRYHELFVDARFMSGVMAVDQLSDGVLTYVPRLGPGLALSQGIDDDAAPYPHVVGPRKLHPVTGVEDDRYWTQFAGGAWNTLNVEVHTLARYRASASYPSQFPRVTLWWCPATRPCIEWVAAALRREVRCFRYGLRGQEVAVGRETCARYHPRTFWQLQECDDCPLPAVSGGDP